MKNKTAVVFKHAYQTQPYRVHHRAAPPKPAGPGPVVKGKIIVTLEFQPHAPLELTPAQLEACAEDIEKGILHIVPTEAEKAAAKKKATEAEKAAEKQAAADKQGAAADKSEAEK